MISRSLPRTLAFSAALFVLPGCGPEPGPGSAPQPTGAPTGSAAPAAEEIPDAIKAAVSAADRDEADKALDAGRKPDKTLAFFRIAPGQQVAEIGAGGGYTAELLARVVGDTGKVYGHNTPLLLQRFAEKPWSTRLQKPIMKPVVRVDREFDDPLPPEAKNLDAVLMILFYHDTVWLKADREKMNKAIFAALKPGGIYGIIDHSAKAGAGLNDVETVHRIEESVLRAEIEKAGFKLDAEGDFLRAPDDTRDWNASPTKAGEKRGTSDRFALRFKKTS